MSRTATFVFGLLIACVFGLWLAFPAIVQGIVPWADPKAGQWTSRGAFGDSYGVLNSLFSALAFCGVAITLYLQHGQLRILKSNESDLEKAQKLQASLMAATALLNYYNSEVDRLQAMGFQIMQNPTPNSGVVSAVWLSRQTHVTHERDALVAVLDRLIKANGNLGASAE